MRSFNIMDRRSFIMQAVVGAIAFPVGTGRERELTIHLEGDEILCDTGSGMLRVGRYKITMKGNCADVELWLDDNAGERILNRLEAEGFKGRVVWADSGSKE